MRLNALRKCLAESDTEAEVGEDRAEAEDMGKVAVVELTRLNEPGLHREYFGKDFRLDFQSPRFDIYFRIRLELNSARSKKGK